MSKLTKRLVDAAEVRAREHFIWDEDLIRGRSYSRFGPAMVFHYRMLYDNGAFSES
jgi:hypothetical protein